MERKLINPRYPSLLFLPALEDRFWNKLSTLLVSKLGGVIIDLEDSIYKNAKDNAREKIISKRTLLEELKKRNPDFIIILRINNLRTVDFKKDISLIQTLASVIDCVMYPKVEEPSEIDELYTHIFHYGIQIFPVIETIKGYMNHTRILIPEKGVKWCAVGGEDLCADMLVERPLIFYDNPLLRHITIDIALLCKFKGINFWGNIWPYLRNSELLEYFIQECLMDRMIGGIGKVAFHPYQIEIINKIFDNSVQLSIQAQTLVDRLTAIIERCKNKGLSVAVSNGRMVDMPEYVRVQRWIEIAEQAQIEESILSKIKQLKNLLENLLREEKTNAE